MTRPKKFGCDVHKIGIILPIEILAKLDDLAKMKGGDRSFTIVELIQNAKVETTTSLNTPKNEPKKPWELKKKGYRLEDMPQPKGKYVFKYNSTPIINGKEVHNE